MWRRERANVTHAIIQNVILIVQGDYTEELATTQRNWVRTSSGYRFPQKSHWKFRSISRENWGKILQEHPNGAGKSDPAVLILSLGFVWHCACAVFAWFMDMNSIAHFCNPFVYQYLSYVACWSIPSIVSVTNPTMLLLLTHVCPLSFGRISPPPFPCWTCSMWLVTLLVGVSTWRRTTSFTGRWTHLCQHGPDLGTDQHGLTMPCLIGLCPAAL